MNHRTIHHVLPAAALDMGGTTVHQPLPTQRVPQIDPFLLLHHFGPWQIEPGGRDPLDVGPHPHRGFEPVTFLYAGGLRHRDSRGNTGHPAGGDVQWMTAGRGIIHSERASRAFVDAGGTLEGIQLWVNLGPEHKMVQPRYQDIKAADIPTVSLPGGAELRLVAGAYGGRPGAADTYSPVIAWQLTLSAGQEAAVATPADHNFAAYLLNGGVANQHGFEYGPRTLLHYRNDGDGILLRGLAEGSRLLLLGGRPLGAPVVSHGPFVMNDQTQILEAMRDYQMGRMGFYVD